MALERAIPISEKSSGESLAAAATNQLDISL
jgi:hypothetical protein